MACGAVILARDTVFNREVLGDAGVFAAADASAIASSVEKMLEDHALRAELGNAASARAGQHYTWLSVLEEYAEAIEQARGDAPVAGERPERSVGEPAEDFDSLQKLNGSAPWISAQ